MTEKGANYSEGRTSMPRIPGGLLVVLAVCTVVVVGACVMFPKAKIQTAEQQDAMRVTMGVQLDGYYAMELPDQKGAFEVVELVKSKEKTKKGQSKGVIRHYVITNPTPAGRVKEGSNITYLEVVSYEGEGNNLSIKQVVGDKPDDVFTYDPTLNTITIAGKVYHAMELNVDHEKLIADILAERAAAADVTEE